MHLLDNKVKVFKIVNEECYSLYLYFVSCDIDLCLSQFKVIN